MPWRAMACWTSIPSTPLRRVTEIDGKHGALLTVEVSRQILGLFAGRE